MRFLSVGVTYSVSLFFFYPTLPYLPSLLLRHYLTFLLSQPPTPFPSSQFLTLPSLTPFFSLSFPYPGCEVWSYMSLEVWSYVPFFNSLGSSTQIFLLYTLWNIRHTSLFFFFFCYLLIQCLGPFMSVLSDILL